MIRFTQSISRFPASPRLRWLPVLAVLAATAVPGSASAAGRGGYDGTWTTVFPTPKVNCSAAYRVPFLGSGRRVSSAGGGRVAGSVNRGGAVAVQVSVGASHATGGGRLPRVAGTGSWNGIISGDRCSGTWQATRT